MAKDEREMKPEETWLGKRMQFLAVLFGLSKTQEINNICTPFYGFKLS